MSPNVHATKIADALIGPWLAVDDETEVAIVFDASVDVAPGRKLFARYDYTEASEVARLNDATLVKRETLEKMRLGAKAILEPFTLPADSLMASLDRCLQHDREVWRRIVTLGLDGGALILGQGKHHLFGAPAGRCYLMGWWTKTLERYTTKTLERYTTKRSGPGWVQEGATSGPGPHLASQRDYATTTILERKRTKKASLLSMLADAARRIAEPFVAIGGHLLAPRPLTLGEALLEEARKDLGVREDPKQGPNRGKEVDAYNLGCGVPMGSPWCASSLTAWLRRAALRLKMTMPILGGAGAKRIMFELQKAGRWFTADEIRRNPALLRPGMIHAWDRGDPGSGQGHVGVHERVIDSARFATVEGNSGSGPHGDGNRVAEMVRRFDDKRWYGAGWVD